MKKDWSYVFKFDADVKDHVYMTNLQTNILVHISDIPQYIYKGYRLGYCKPYTSCKNLNK